MKKFIFAQEQISINGQNTAIFLKDIGVSRNDRVGIIDSPNI